ncbi:putative phosphoenolpyruvate synthase [Daphnia magna]|uniref:putative phosphoenolpyruvate synthase n=1 Tax=Daphnia magna TaxID=35525 RepID=UPI0014022103|nr:putative phosphoenolpyruvate synthase [Daphnia magna]
MDASQCLVLLFTALVFFALLRKLLWSPQVPDFLRSPYTQPGPWYPLKIMAARVWLTWKLIKIPRVLNNVIDREYDDVSSEGYKQIGKLAPTNAEMAWEQPHQLKTMIDLDGLSFYGTDGSGTFLQVAINRLINRQAQVTLLFTVKDGTVYQLPVAPDTLISNTDGRDSFNSNGALKFQLIEAMRKWRVTFNGLAKRRRHGKESEVHLKINLLWAAFSRPFEFKREFSRKLLAQGMARERWRGKLEWSQMSEPTVDGVDQWGVLCGTYQDSSLGDEKEIYLRSLRQRRWGQNNASTLRRKLDLIGTCEDGNYFYLSATSDSARLTHEVWGHIYQPNGFLYKINACDLDLESLGEKGPFPNHFSIHFAAKNRNYHAVIHLLPSTPTEHFIGRPWRHRSTTYPSQLTLNSRQGRAMLVATHFYDGNCPLESEESVPYLSAPTRQPSSAELEKLVLLFEEEACRFDSLVGGKGSSLALLSSDLKKFPVECKVPAGFCVTVNAWKAQLKNNEEVGAVFKHLEDVATGVVEGKLEESCAQAEKLVSSVPVDALLQDCIREALQDIFGDDAEQRRFAVRSSAVGEDGDVLSSAGQNITVLGCQGFDSIKKGLQNCWASLLSYQSVEYRRQHGEPLIPGMGVVIQEMVDAEAAGVLFTVNPNDGDPGKMILTANYGLGESVVSASADPDTFYIKRTAAGELSVSSRMVGSKQSKIILSDDGTREEKITEEDAVALCLTDDKVLEIGQLGVYLEKAFGGPRDLEFAVSRGALYLLQARPVTALDAWTDFELRHEFDSPILTDSDYFTKANTGEVFPGATSPLGLSVTASSLDLSFQFVMKEQFGKHFEVNPWCIGRFNLFHQNQVFINVIDTFQRDIEEEITAHHRSVDMAIFGHLVSNSTMHQIGKQRFGIAGWGVKYLRFRHMFMDMCFNNRRVKRAVQKFSDYSIPSEKYIDSQKLYDEICSQLPRLLEISNIHLQVSRAGTITQLIAFIILLDGRDEWTPELYGEMAQLLSSISNIESADVPVALKQIAQAILKSEDAKEFSEHSPEIASVWLETDPGLAGRLFRSFIARHGHRGIKEFDVATETWAMNTRPLVSVLQSMVANPASLAPTSQPTKSNDDWLKIIGQSKPGKYRALKFFVPRSRNAVIAREKTKSLLIRTIHVFRMAYRRLAHLLVRDGKIPDSNLIFFFTHSELQELIRANGVALINKANRRRKLYPELDALVFPEMSLGIPKPLQDSSSEEVSVADGVQLTGTPVFKGTVRATVRVALNLEEAKQIQNGDILITRSTDIGWSPYFPLLSGVVTELGGLISHGAVVAREYGLPAIVGCNKVTQVFRSGDVVILDGSKGTITRMDAT